jgi:hypothetical protein
VCVFRAPLHLALGAAIGPLGGVKLDVLKKRMLERVTEVAVSVCFSTP